jgi:DNA-binding FrmR family transcriptional regulator
MKIEDSVKEDLHRRLRRIEGQVRGIQNMIEEERECRDIVTQIAAATKAMEQVGFRMLASGLTHCLQNPDESAASGYSIEDVEKMFLKLS